MPTGFDVAVVGSTLFAGILAGQLADVHGRRVLRIGRRPSPQRLPRRIDMALMIATRVRTWDVLARGAGETSALVSRIGAVDAIVPVSVRVHADTERSGAALAHLAHVAAGYGLKAGRKAGSSLFPAVPLLRTEHIEDKIASWLSAAGVRTVDPDALRTEFDGNSIVFRAGDETLAATQVLLADDAAILDFPEDERPAGVVVESIAATLLGKTRPLGAQVLSFVDRGVRLQQRTDGSVLALVSGEAELEARLASALPGPFPISRLATGRSRRIVTADGAPSFARLGASNVRIAAGLGDAAPFFATAVARHVAGVTEADERAWFAAHEASVNREGLAEFVA